MFGKSNQETKPYQEIPPADVSPALPPEPFPAPAPKPPIQIDTIIGEGTRIVGTLHCKTILRIDGIVEGDVHSENKVVVSEKGLLKGNVSAEHFTLGGELSGNAKVRGKAEILSTGKLYGDILTKTLIMDENAVFDGKCTMTKAEEEIKKEELPDLPGLKEVMDTKIP